MGFKLGKVNQPAPDHLRKVESKRARLVRKMETCKQVQVAAKIGYDQSQISRAVRGRMIPSRDFGSALAVHFGVTLDEIIDACFVMMEKRKKAEERNPKKHGKKSGFDIIVKAQKYIGKKGGIE